MSEFKGTKGKWEVRQEKDSNGFISIDLPNKRVITYYGELKRVEDDFPEESKANALLISKAPEMLEMLIDFVETYESGGFINNEYYVDKFKQLIKEATEL